MFFSKAFLFALCAQLVTETHAFLRRGRFKTSALYNVDVGLTNIEGTVVAFGDFNSDKFTDLFVLSEDQTTVTVHTWVHLNWKFEKSKANITISKESNFIITNILPGDFNYDGKLDLLVMGQKDPPKGELFMRVYIGNGKDTFDQVYLEVPSAMSPQPIPFDYAGNMTTDLLGYVYHNNSDMKLSIWKNLYGPERKTGNLFEVLSFPFNETTEKTCKWSEPHSNAFVDLNGDCLSDLFFTCQKDPNGPITSQIWTNSKLNGFDYSRSYELPKGVGQVSFADMDGDGTIDMVFPVCEEKNKKCEIHIAYNKQIPLCSDNKSTNCRQATNLCTADDNFKFDFSQDRLNNAYVILQNIGNLMILDKAFKGFLPVPIRIGDYNLDGYPDILVISETGSVSLWQSVLCTSGKCWPAAVNAQRRTFVKVVSGAEALNSLTEATAATFLDLDEDGTLDIMVLKSSGSKSTTRNVEMIHNNYFNDAFFVKTLVLNGVEEKQKPFGVNYPGATFKFTILDTSGKKRANQVAQYSQTGYISLQAPYCLFGLGRTNNYVEELFVGTTRNQSQHYSTFSGVIPNSQLIIIPYQPPGVDDPSTWSLELYIHPGVWVPWVLITLMTATGILAIVVFGLSWAEKREDAMEKRKALHVINFDAL
ncbi:hypothetical protein G9A89_016711 [Geosiphon pyriformis]|nr:hypothetical protein G9A89_016711 [Geosiphon pyriformis]